MSSRRSFLLNCSALAATASFMPPAAWAGVALRDAGLEEISVAGFAAQLNSTFVAREVSGRATAMQLVAVDATGPGDTEVPVTATTVRERFSLLFVGAVTQPLGQGTYRFEHTKLGPFEMFIVPVEKPLAECCVYEAIFDRVVSKFPGRVRARVVVR